MAGTPTTERAVRTAKAPGRRRAPLALAAIVTTTWAALVSYVPVVAAVALFAGRPQLSIGTGGWLLAHGVPLSTSAGRFGLIPLGLSVLAAWRVGRAGVHTSRAIGARTPGRVALAVGRPPVLRDGLRTGTVAALLVLGAGAGVAGVALAVSGGQAAATLASYHTGVAGQVGVTLLCLAFAPNLATWSAAYLVGPGFAFGTGTTVSAASVKLGALPAVPVLAGLPDSAVFGLRPARRHRAGRVAGRLGGRAGDRAGRAARRGRDPSPGRPPSAVAGRRHVEREYRDEPGQAEQPGDPAAGDAGDRHALVVGLPAVGLVEADDAQHHRGDAERDTDVEAAQQRDGDDPEDHREQPERVALVGAHHRQRCHRRHRVSADRVLRHRRRGLRLGVEG